MPQDERGTSNQRPHEDDPYIEALERFKKRSFATFGVLIFLIAMAIAVIVEAAGAKKVWDAVFSETVHAEPVRAEPVQTSPCLGSTNGRHFTLKRGDREYGAPSMPELEKLVQFDEQLDIRVQAASGKTKTKCKSAITRRKR